MGLDQSHTQDRSYTRRRFISAGVSGSAALYLAACGGSSSSSSSSAAATTSGNVTLNNLFQQQAGYSAQDLAGMTAAFEKAHPNIKVNNTLVTYDALHDKIVSAAPAGTYDVVLGDVIWPAEFGSKGIVKDISSLVATQPTSQIFPGALVMARYNGKYYGMPWILDTKYMFANGTMLKKAGVSPSSLKTWDGVVSALKQIKAKGIVKYPWLGSWSQAEAVVCDYAQLLGAFGGKFLDASGKPAFQTGGGLQALQFMKMLLDQGLADPASTSSLEADVLKAFAQGRIAMNLNWTFQLAGALDPTQSTVSKDNILILHTPQGIAGTTAPGCNGGQPVMIASGSKHPNEAWTYIQFITSQTTQNNYVKDSLPIWSSSYKDPNVIKNAGAQLVDVAKTQLPNMILRPQVTNYNSSSQALQVQIQDALLGKKTPQAALNDAAAQFTSGAPPA
ncbi:MAG TPA: extracellular solute-binding protein [Solirubrobacteraceae bacterium]|nr:extracellular solute-binding protein [Solirubrobacteraceae bacterium]